MKKNRCYRQPSHIEKHLTIADEDPEVTRAKMFILEQFINITNERLEESMEIVSRYEAHTAAKAAADAAAAEAAAAQSVVALAIAGPSTTTTNTTTQAQLTVGHESNQHHHHSTSKQNTPSNSFKHLHHNHHNHQNLNPQSHQSLNKQSVNHSRQHHRQQQQHLNVETDRLLTSSSSKEDESSIVRNGAIPSGDVGSYNGSYNEMTTTTSTNKIVRSSDYESKLHRQLKKSYREAREESVNGKFCIPYFTCAIDTDNIKRVFKACSHILKKEHLENSGLL